MVIDEGEQKTKENGKILTLKEENKIKNNVFKISVQKIYRICRMGENIDMRYTIHRGQSGRYEAQCRSIDQDCANRKQIIWRRGEKLNQE